MFKGYFDGASRSNPGHASYGAVIYDQQTNEVLTDKKYIGVQTNNIAEYSGAISIIELCIQNNIDSIDIYGDSNLVIKQITNQWKVKSDSIRPYYQKMKQLLDSHTWKHIGFHHVKRKFNKRADALANEALDETDY